jgi:hypothetical protein
MFCIGFLREKTGEPLQRATRLIVCCVFIVRLRCALSYFAVMVQYDLVSQSG